ncbi:hypothetical protein ACHHYP_10961 [Achlya hypogyna]|uniref:Transmembrane protein n=1 Tax=Achlya hypogyna TaxID=1202772 RepID=A0A1V9YK63_ACHHY|nr:hypothetical protein ACHHYP_10961 [Achlya hypogyna]
MPADVELGFDELDSPTTASGSSASHRYPSFDRRWLFQCLAAVVLVAVFLATFLPTLMIHHSRTSYSLLYQDAKQDAALPLSIVLSGVNTDTNQIAAQLYYDATTLPSAVNVAIGASSISLNPDTSNTGNIILQQFTITSGSTTMFPFDEFMAPLTVRASSVTTLKDVPVVLSIYSAADFNWQYNVYNGSSLLGPGSSGVLGHLNIVASRHPLFFSYVFVMWFGIWVVGVSLAYIASSTIIWQRRPVDNPMVYFSGLIVIPIFRNTAPGHPPYGCLFDMTSTYLALLIAAFGMLFATFISMKPKPSQVNTTKQ